MNSSCIFFKISDIIFHYPRNYKRYPDVIRENNLVYDARFGAYTKADIYYKKQEGKYPVLVNVHGGGFVKGDKRHRSGISCFWAENGWFVYNINHRLAPQYVFPAGVEDTVNAVNYLAEIADKYNLDLNRVVLSGDSSGAYYAAAAVIAATNEAYRTGLGLPECKQKIAAFVGFCGPYELEKLLSKKTPLNIARNVADCLFGYKIKKDLSNMKDFSKFDYINLISYAGAGFPESFLVIAKNDSFCGGQGEMLRDFLKESGVKCGEYYAADKGDTHCFHLLPWTSNTKRCLKAVKEWSDGFLGKN